MFTTEDNNGYIQINFHSVANTARSIGLRAAKVGAHQPNTISNMGGYVYPILEKMANGRPYQILRTHIPTTDKEDSELASVMLDSDTVYETVDATVLTIVQIEGWDESLAEHGWRIRSGPKTPKRVKTLHRPFRLWANPQRSLKVAIVDDDDYTENELVVEMEEGTKERLLDGAFVISPDLYKECLQNLNVMSQVADLETTDGIRNLEMRLQFSNIKVFNARIHGKFTYKGLDPEDEFHWFRGGLKGQAFICADDRCEKMKVDIIAPRSAFKADVFGDDTFVLLDPQTTKWKVSGDVQSGANVPALYDPDFSAKWIRYLILNQFEDLKNDKLMSWWYSMTSPSFYSTHERKFGDDDLVALTKWNARNWVMSGMKLTDSPWLFEQMVNNIIGTIDSASSLRMKVPIPCAVRAQVISQSLASLIGIEEFDEVETGMIRWSAKYGVLVVNDLDWLEMYESHGGNDLDDFFVAAWRTMDSARKVIVMRSPNDFGEYTIFDYVEGDWYPTEELHDDRRLEFPTVSTDPALWPKRLSEAVADGDVEYRGLASSRMEKTTTDCTTFYSHRDVFAAIENNASSQQSVGANVNARGLWSLTMRQHRSLQLAPLETCIDTGTQGGCAEDIEEVIEESKEILQMILDSGLPVDRYYWETRFAPLGYEIEPERLDSSSHLCRIHDFKKHFTKQFLAHARQYMAQNVGRNVDENIHRLGAKFLHKGSRIVSDARRAIAAARINNGGQTNVDDWREIHEDILDCVEELPTAQEQHDLVLGIYSACLKYPTVTTGRISDQIVQNPAMFDKLIGALRYYGIAAYLRVDQWDRIVSEYDNKWEITCEACYRSAWTDDPLLVQRHFYARNTCADCCK